LPVEVVDPALVGEGGAFVGGAGDDLGVLLVADIVAKLGLVVGHVRESRSNVHGEGVLVVAVADVGTVVLLIGAAVDQTLRVVHIAILAVATQVNGIAGVLQAEEVKTTHAAGITGLDTDSDTVLSLLVDDDVVAAAEGERAVEVAGDVLLAIELDRGVLDLDVEQLLHVEDLDTVALELTADDHVVLVRTDLSPVSAVGSGCELGPKSISVLDRKDYKSELNSQVSEVQHATLRKNFNHGATIVHARNDELATRIGVDPTP
jgi:hypothetical protein